MVPEPSLPSTSGKSGLPSGHQPPRICASQLPAPAVCTAMRISLVSISGTGSVWMVTSSGPPKRSMAAARIVFGMLGIAGPPQCGQDASCRAGVNPGHAILSQTARALGSFQPARVRRGVTSGGAVLGPSSHESGGGQRNTAYRRPIIIGHGSHDPIVSPGETAVYKRLVEASLGARARDFLAIYYTPKMGHGGVEYDASLSAQLDALEKWVDYHQSGGRSGSPPPNLLVGGLGSYPRN